MLAAVVTTAIQLDQIPADRAGGTISAFWRVLREIVVAWVALLANISGCGFRARAEPVIGPRYARTRRPGMTVEMSL
jgi:hypothetical protein